MLRDGDILRWEAELHQVRGDGSRVPVEITIAAVTDHPGGEPVLLVQETDVSARKRVEGLRDGLVAIRHTIVSATTWEQAAPQLLGALCAHLDWDLAQYWAVDTDLQALRLRQSWHRDGAAFEEFHSQSRRLSIASGEGLLGRVWQSGIPAAQEDLAGATDYDRVAVALCRPACDRRSPSRVITGGSVIGVIEMLTHEPRMIENDLVTMLSTAGGEIGHFIRRAETAQALRRSEADHRAIFERSPIGIARISSEGELLEANPALLTMLEHDFQVMRSHAWPDLLRAYDQAAARARFSPLLAGISEGKSVQVRAGTGGGNWLWLQLTRDLDPRLQRPARARARDGRGRDPGARDAGQAGRGARVAAQRQRDAREAGPHQDRVPVDRQPRVPDRAHRHPGLQRAHPRRRPRAGRGARLRRLHIQ